MESVTRHQIEWAARALRSVAQDAGVALPVDYSIAVAADGLNRAAELAVSRLGAGVVLHTAPGHRTRLPVVLGYADARGQWYRDGRRHPAVTIADEAQPAEAQVAL